MYFSVKCEKPKINPRCFRKPKKNPTPSGRNPRTQDWIEEPKILGENPRSGNAYHYRKRAAQSSTELCAALLAPPIVCV